MRWRRWRTKVESPTSELEPRRASSSCSPTQNCENRSLLLARSPSYNSSPASTQYARLQRASRVYRRNYRMNLWNLHSQRKDAVVVLRLKTHGVEKRNRISERVSCENDFDFTSRSIDSDQSEFYSDVDFREARDQSVNQSINQSIDKICIAPPEKYGRRCLTM